MIVKLRRRAFLLVRIHMVNHIKDMPTYISKLSLLVILDIK